MDLSVRTPIGSSGLTLPRFGLGTAALGGWPEPVDDERGVGTIREAWGEGIRYFDTAPFYGYGKSENFIREALAREPRDSFVLSTKAGRVLVPGAEPDPFYTGGLPMTPVPDFSADGIRRSLADSRARLGIERIDICYLHDPDDYHDQVLDESFPALAELRAEGVIGAIGVGMNWSEPLSRFAREADFDCLMEAGRYTLLEQDCLDDLMPAVQERGIPIIAGGVFNSGILVNPRDGATYTYAPASEEILAKARAIDATCREFDVPLRAAALQFPLGHPSVATVVIGATRPAEVADNLAMIRVPIPDELWATLKHRGLLREDAPVPSDERKEQE